MHTGPPRASLPTAPLRGGEASISAVGAKRSAATLGAARWRVWAPILMRAVALGLALLGLAGIGLVASRSPELSALSSPGVGLDLAGLGSHAVGTAAGGAALAGPAPSLASPSASSSSSPEPSLPAPLPPAPSSPEPLPPEPAAAGSPSRGPVIASPASTPCPKTAPPAAVAGVPRAAAEAGAAAVSPGARVVLNQANAEELVRLPGVGTKRAAAILALRQRLGRFRRPSDLLRIRGIGPRTLERMLPHLVVD